MQRAEQQHFQANQKEKTRCLDLFRNSKVSRPSRSIFRKEYPFLGENIQDQRVESCRNSWRDHSNHISSVISDQDKQVINDYLKDHTIIDANKKEK